MASGPGRAGRQRAVPDGLHDRLLEFTRSVSGASFFAPSLHLLRSLERG